MSMVEDLIGTITQQGGLSDLADSLGIDARKAAIGLTAAAPLILGALRRNASHPSGARALHEAVQRDHDGGLLGQIGGFLTRGDTREGDAILGHVFGPRRDAAVRGLGKSTGLDMNAAGKMLAMAAPLILAQLGQHQRQKGLSADGLAGLVGDQASQLEDLAGPLMHSFGSLLDADHDGEVEVTDIMTGGGRLLQSVERMLAGRA